MDNTPIVFEGKRSKAAIRSRGRMAECATALLLSLGSSQSCPAQQLSDIKPSPAFDAERPGQLLCWRKHTVYRFQIYLTTNIRLRLREFVDQPDVRAVSDSAEANRSVPDRLRAWLLLDVEDLVDDARRTHGVVRIFHAKGLRDLYG
jgi:hypothetical protein